MVYIFYGFAIVEDIADDGRGDVGGKQFARAVYHEVAAFESCFFCIRGKAFDDVALFKIFAYADKVFALGEFGAVAVYEVVGVLEE